MKIRILNVSSKGPEEINITSPMSIPIICLVIISSTVASLGTISGNILVLIAFFVERNIRTPSNYFIISLAVTDLLIGLISMNLFTTYLIIGNWPLSQLLCDLWLSLDYTACLTSQYTVFFITVDRFCSVKIPATYRLWRTKNKVIIMVIVSWVVPSILFFTSILGWPIFNNGRQRRSDQCYAEFTLNTVFNTLLTIVYFWITLVVMCILYAGIYHIAKRLQASSDKRKGMTTLIAMAGQTMSRIGVGVSCGNGEDIDDNIVANCRINNGPDEYNNKNGQDNIVFETLSPYKLNAPPDLVKNIQFIDENSSENGSTTIYKSIYFNKNNGDQEPGISEILPPNKVKTSNFMKKMPVKNLKSKMIQAKSIKSQSKNHEDSKVAVSHSNSLQHLQFAKFAFIHKKDNDIRSRNRARKALKTISFILGAFVTCWTPYHILVLIKGFCDEPLTHESCVNNHLYNLSYWLCYINSPINPFCYALANTQIKTTLMRLLRRDFRRNV